MGNAEGSTLIEVLQSTLRQLEENEELNPNDPALLELRNVIVRMIAELEVTRMPNPTAA